MRRRKGISQSRDDSTLPSRCARFFEMTAGLWIEAYTAEGEHRRLRLTPGSPQTPRSARTPGSAQTPPLAANTRSSHD